MWTVHLRASRYGGHPFTCLRPVARASERRGAKGGPPTPIASRLPPPKTGAFANSATFALRLASLAQGGPIRLASLAQGGPIRLASLAQGGPIRLATLTLEFSVAPFAYNSA